MTHIIIVQAVINIIAVFNHVLPAKPCFSGCLQVNRDVMVWTNKTYIPNPLLVKEDHLIVNHRRWYSQFYSENSPRLKPSRNEEEEDLSW